ncbi:MAG: hypothetical protein EBR30_16555 [Cytophagia bacterium]|nr:hypothetical protein [Cytophagia bacterium]
MTIVTFSQQVNYKAKLKIMRYLLFWLTISLMVINCKEKENLTTSKEIEKLGESPQSFTLVHDKAVKLETRNGAIITIEPNTFEFSDGMSPDKTIHLDVKEVYQKSEMILDNLTTTSDGRLLESLGMIFMEASSEGKQLKLKRNKSISVSIPNKNGIYNGELFYGEKTDSVLNWKYAGTTRDITEVVEIVIPKSDRRNAIKRTTYKYIDGVKEFVSDTTFIIKGDYASNVILSIGIDSAIGMPQNTYEFQIENLGWINCDRFVEVQEKVDFTIKLENHSDPVGYLVFSSINSVMPVYFDKNGKAMLSNLPKDYNVDLLVIDKIKDDMMWVKKPLKIRSDNEMVLKTSKISKEKLKAAIKALDKSK